MSRKAQDSAGEELTPEIRKALVEFGAHIPTTPEEVELAEAHLTLKLSSAQLDEAVARIEKKNSNSATLSFICLTKSTPPTDGLALAARNGKKFTPETIKKIESSIDLAAR
jgi:hypothetical protein